MKTQLKALREAAKLTQEEAAQKIGVVQSAISMWETGGSTPRTELLIRIAQAYNCTISELFESEIATTA